MVYLDSAEVLGDTAPSELSAKEIPIRFRLVESADDLAPVRLLNNRNTGREIFLRDIKEESKYWAVFVYGEGENHNAYIDPMDGKELRQQVDKELEFSRASEMDGHIVVYLCETDKARGGV
ncbi:MAG: hypothetical protein AABX65_04665 [Nanoarchaeota archaeon]